MREPAYRWGFYSLCKLSSQNQLFCKTPDNIILEKIFEAFNLENIHDTRVFTRKDLIKNKTVEKLNLIPELQNYYLPCKAKIYLDVITEKRAVTILSQFIKLFSYKLARKERIINKKKVIFYRIQKIEDTKLHIDNSSTYELLF